MLSASYTVSIKAQGLTLGVCRSRMPGTMEVFLDSSGRKSAAELLRVTVEGTNATGQQAFPPLSFTFSPSLYKPTTVNLELSLPFKEFLVGLHRSQSGLLRVQFFAEGAQPASVLLSTEEFIRLYRGKGKKAPESAPWCGSLTLIDSPEVAALSSMSLKARSDQMRKEAEAKRLQAEEEAKKKEAERLALAAKAAEEKAKAAGGTATAPAAAVDKSKPSITAGRVMLVYGSSTGNTTEVANMIKAELGADLDHVKNITEIGPLDFGVPECLILGVPTWHVGEMQDDWASVLPEFEKAAINLAGKKIAVYGLGDFKGYPDTYVDAMQELAEKFEKKGAKLVGMWPTEGYDFKKSKAVRNNKFLGLVIDVENQDDQSTRRVKEWCQQLRTELLS